MRASGGGARVHLYEDDQGRVLRKKIKPRPGGGKAVVWQRKVGTSWKLGLNGNQPGLYRQRELEAADPSEPVWVTEGEKDADAAWALGLIATTNPGGAGKGKWRDEFSELLRGRDVYVVWDRDEPGERHAREVERSLRAHGARVTFLRADEGNDLADHLAEGLGVDELIEEDPPEPPEEPPATAPGASDEPVAFLLAVERLRAGGFRPRETDPDTHQHEARCPAHDDKSPSLSLAPGNGVPIVATCHAGCSLEQIAAALGMQPSHFIAWSDQAEAYDPDLAKELKRQRDRDRARQILAAERAPRLVFPSLGSTLRDELAEPDEEEVYAIEGLAPEGGNVLIPALRKTGKTILVMNLAKALVDGQPFLGTFAVREIQGSLAFLNYELSASMFRRWARAIGFKNPERVRPLHLRGQSLPFWLPETRDATVEWLRGIDAESAIIDPAGRASHGLVLNDNDNAQVRDFCAAVDAIKEAAGLREVYVPIHMGWQPQPEGQERTRGASEWEGWMDAGWYYTADEDGARFLRAYGRDVEVEAFALTFDPHTHALTHAGVTRTEKRAEDAIRRVCEAVAEVEVRTRKREHRQPKTAEVEDAINGLQKDRRSRAIQEAERSGYLLRRLADGTQHPLGERTNKPLFCELTEAGRNLLAPHVGLEAN